MKELPLWKNLVFSLIPLLVLEVGSYVALLVIKQADALYSVSHLTDSGWREYRAQFSFDWVDMLYGWRNSPNKKFATIGMSNLETDEDGFIHTGQKFDRSKKGFYLLGGSTMAGYGASSNQTTIPGYLQRELDKLGNHHAARNCGVPAYGSFHEMRFLGYELVFDNPDIVLVMDGVNNFVRTPISRFPYTRTLAYSEYLVGNQEGINKTPPVVHPEWAVRITNVLATTRLLRLGWGYWTDMIARGHESRVEKQELEWSDEEISRAVREHLRMWTNIIGIAQANKIKLILVSQPTIFAKKNLTKHEYNLLAEFRKANPIQEKAPFVRYLRALSTEIDSFKLRYEGDDVVIADFSDLFLEEEGEMFSIDPIHYNDTANERLAKQIASVAAQKGWL